MTKELNEQRQNQELWSNAEQSKEQMNQLKIEPRMASQRCETNQRMKMNRTMNGVPKMSNLRNK